MAAGVVPVGVKCGHRTQKQAASHVTTAPMNSVFARGRWDRNRTCTLRCWSLLPYVQHRSGAYTSMLEMAHFDGPECQDVPQRSPSLGSTVGSKQSEIL